MKLYYSRIPADAVFRMFDGNMYANIPHSLGARGVTESFTQPRMVRFDAASFIRSGEAYVYFGRTGDAAPVGHVPFGVTVLDQPLRTQAPD